MPIEYPLRQSWQMYPSIRKALRFRPWLVVAAAILLIPAVMLILQLYHERVWQTHLADWTISLCTYLTAIGEFAIVWAILHEVKGSRQTEFLQKVFQTEYYQDRSKLYTEFVNTMPASPNPPNRATIWKASEELLKKINQNSELRKRCDSQLTHLNQIALLFGKPTGDDNLTEWFPHAVAITWTILLPYILKRKNLQGHFWAAALDRFAFHCLRFVMDDPEAHLSIYADAPDGTGPSRSITLSNAVLKDIQMDLKRVTKCNSRREVGQVEEDLKTLYAQPASPLEPLS